MRVVEVQARIQVKPPAEPTPVDRPSPTADQESTSHAKKPCVRVQSEAHLEVLQLKSEEIEAGSVTFFGIAVLQTVVSSSRWVAQDV